jgi:hypothetical protein
MIFCQRCAFGDYYYDSISLLKKLAKHILQKRQGKIGDSYSLEVATTAHVHVGPQIGMNPISVWGLPNLEY